nr:PREDICTED: protein phosphatase 1 regulatory subunit 15A-like [Lepisosteus oculatus]
MFRRLQSLKIPPRDMDPPNPSRVQKAMERFGGTGVLAVPWTWPIWTILFEHLRFLVQVVCCTFWTVFQMCRLEVHLRITDETGHHVQHMGAGGNAGPSFIISSLLDSNSRVVVSGSNHVALRGATACAGNSEAGSLISSLQAEDICRSFVDDFVLRAAECFADSVPSDGAIPLPPHSRLDNLAGHCKAFLPPERESGEEVYPESVTEEPLTPFPSPVVVGNQDDSFWDDDDDDDDDGEDAEDSQVLWESFTKLDDPYNLLCFSACISSRSPEDSLKSPPTKAAEALDAKSESSSSGSDTEELRKTKITERRQALGRSCQDSGSDWECSSEDDEGDPEENQKLWESFAKSSDPYNPLRFTARAGNSSPKTALCGEKKHSDSEEEGEHDSPTFGLDTKEKKPCDELSCNLKESDDLWNSFSQSTDPYHPLHFRACLKTSPPCKQSPRGETSASHVSQQVDRSKPELPKRQFKHYCPARISDSPQRAVWKKPSCVNTLDVEKTGRNTEKKVSFSPVVQVHVMHAWSFALRAARRGPWEEMARDRARFRRRIEETEKAIGHCLSTAHREKILASLQSTASKNTPPAAMT